MLRAPPAHLAEFQKSYSAHIRSPATTTCPEGIPKRRSRVYEELLLNNTKGFIEKCFPVSQSLFTKEQWLHLAQAFFQHWACHTPYFSQIPAEFVQFVRSGLTSNPAIFPEGIPPWLPSLLHYEWLELEVELSKATVLDNTANIDDQSRLSANPTLSNTQYDWQVHQISQDFMPTEPKPTFLLVYRSPTHTVEFMEVNAITANLVRLFEEESSTIEVTFEKLCSLAAGVTLEQAQKFGRPLINDLICKHVLIVD